jgi:protein-disulfide isomerase
MQQNASDPRMPIVIGMIVLGVVLLGGIVWAIVSVPAGTTPNGNPNLSFQDENDPTRGPDDAPIVIRAFEDLECPACRNAKAGVEYVMQKYGDKVRLIWNDFPLPATIHPNARLAANAARCAEEQGKFWEMVDAIYDAQPTWSRASNVRGEMEAFAGKLELDMQGFTSCMSDRRHDNKIAADMAEGNANGVNSTPTFFVNNVMYAGGMSNAQWDAIIQPLVNAAKTSTPEPMPETTTSTTSTQ